MHYVSVLVIIKLMIQIKRLLRSATNSINRSSLLLAISTNSEKQFFWLNKLSITFHRTSIHFKTLPNTSAERVLHKCQASALSELGNISLENLSRNRFGIAMNVPFRSDSVWAFLFLYIDSIFHQSSDSVPIVRFLFGVGSSLLLHSSGLVRICNWGANPLE